MSEQGAQQPKRRSRGILGVVALVGVAAALLAAAAELSGALDDVPAWLTIALWSAAGVTAATYVILGRAQPAEAPPPPVEIRTEGERSPAVGVSYGPINTGDNAPPRRQQ